MRFDDLEDFRRIFVVGPQRSGTRYIAKCICRDTGVHLYVDEKEFMVDSLHMFQRLLWDVPFKMVVQCPGVTAWIHALVEHDDMVVFCWRDLPDILHSQKLAWPTRSYDRIEALKYGRSGDSAKIKQHYWATYQEARIGNSMVVQFPEDVNDRDDYVPKAARVGWAVDQTEPK